MKPFRWNMAKREQLGDLLDGDVYSAYKDYEAELKECAAKVLARSINRRLIFVGRSPENIFDYLAGTLHGTKSEKIIDLLNISNRFRDVSDIRKELPQSYAALQQHFFELNIAPNQLISSPEGICFCDLVATGGTFEQLFFFLKTWSEDEALDFSSVLRKIGFIGITQRQKNSPNTWRWQQQLSFVKEHRGIYIKNVSVPVSLWHYLGNVQHKVTDGNIPEKWGRDEVLIPSRDENNLKSLRQAYQIFQLGKNQKQQMVAQLALCPEFREPWLRAVSMEIKMAKG